MKNQFLLWFAVLYAPLSGSAVLTLLATFSETFNTPLETASLVVAFYSIPFALFQLLSGKPFAVGSIDSVREAAAQTQLYERARRGPLQGHPAQVVALLERVVVPRGERRIRTLKEYTEASKEVYTELLGGVKKSD